MYMKPKNVKQLLNVIESLQWDIRHMITELSLVAIYLDEVDKQYNCYGETELVDITGIINYLDPIMDCYDGLEVNLNLDEQIASRLKHYGVSPYFHLLE